MTDEFNVSNPRPHRYCPHDAFTLVLRPDLEGTPRPSCLHCGYVDYANPKPCVEALVEQGGRLLLGQRGIEPSKGMWDILGGFMHAGETVEEALCREIREESGLTVRPDRFLGSFPATYGKLVEPIIILCFTAIPLDGTLQAGTDIAELRWFDRNELPHEMAFPHQRRVIEEWLKPGS